MTANAKSEPARLRRLHELIEQQTMFLPDDVQPSLESYGVPSEALELYRKAIQHGLIDSELADWLEVEWKADQSPAVDETLTRLAKDILNQLIERGFAEVVAGERSSTATHGSTQDRNLRYVNMQSALERARDEYADWSYTRLSEYVGKLPLFQCSGRTIRRHTTDPTKK